MSWDGRDLATQRARGSMYSGTNATHSSHVIPAEQRAYFGLSRQDHLANYRNVNAFTNQAVHTTIDNHLLSQSRNHSFVGGPVHSPSAGTISSREVADRVQRQIDVAKVTGDIHNDRFRNFLSKSASAYGIDRRQFNGYK